MNEVFPQGVRIRGDLANYFPQQSNMNFQSSAPIGGGNFSGVPSGAGSSPLGGGDMGQIAQMLSQLLGGGGQQQQMPPQSPMGMPLPFKGMTQVPYMRGL